MEPLDIRLKCTACRAYREFDPVPGTEAVRCSACGKRHSRDSLHAVEPGEEATFD